jgi:hypothetical protein
LFGAETRVACETSHRHFVVNAGSARGPTPLVMMSKTRPFDSSDWRK